MQLASLNYNTLRHYPNHHHQTCSQNKFTNRVSYLYPKLLCSVKGLLFPWKQNSWQNEWAASETLKTHLHLPTQNTEEAGATIIVGDRQRVCTCVLEKMQTMHSEVSVKASAAFTSWSPRGKWRLTKGFKVRNHNAKRQYKYLWLNV